MNDAASGNALTWLSQQWRNSGITPGDMVLLHSSLKRTLLRLKAAGFPPSTDIVLDSFLEAVGPDGTLILPLFNFGFCTGQPFDIRTTSSAMGALTETARTRPNAVRTGHPIYSFAVLGARSNDFRGLDNISAYGPDSPFGMLHRAGGRIAILDLPDQNSMTFYHYVEEARGAPWRFHKRFTAPYTGWAGTTSDRTYLMYVRDLDKGVQTAVNPMGEELWRLRLYSGDRPGQGSGLRVIDAAKLFDAVADVIDGGRGEGLLYTIDPAKRQP